MKNMILKIVAILGCMTMFVGTYGCKDPEGCAADPVYCAAYCAGNPEDCIDENAEHLEIQIDSVEAVSKLPVRQ